MPVYLYKKIKKDEEESFLQVKKINLAGYNAVFKLWEKKGKPLERGWNITKEELIEYALGKEGEVDMHSALIEITPSRKNEINLLEVLDIYLYTYREKKTEKAGWSNLMLRLGEIFGTDLESEEDKARLTKEFPFKRWPEENVYTFLYLKGEEGSWNWSRRGQMNGALIFKEAAAYFKEFFR